MGNCIFRCLCSCCMNSINDYKPLTKSKDVYQVKSSKTNHYKPVAVDDTEKKMVSDDYVDIKHIDKDTILVTGYARQIQKTLQSEDRLCSSNILTQSIMNIICMYHHPSTHSVFHLKLSFMENSPEMTVEVNQIVVNVKQMFLNGSSLFFLDTKDHIYVYGDNTAAKLGILPTIGKDYFNHPAILPILDAESNAFYQKHTFRVISSASIGTKHTFAVTTNNDVYAYGFPGYHQLFGTEPSVKNSHVVPGDYISKTREAFWPTLVPMEPSLNIIDIRLGEEHSLFLTDNGKVLGCGNKYEYTLPVDIKTETKTPVLIECLSKDTIVEIRCGAKFSLVLNNNGVLKAFGSNEKGQLGNGKTSNNYYNDHGQAAIIEVASHEPRIVTMECGYAHICCLDAKGCVYCWGLNSGKQCCVEEGVKVKRYKHSKDKFPEYDDCVARPTCVDLPNRITNISCSGYGTVVMDLEMNLYFWGDVTARFSTLDKYDIKRKRNTEVLYDVLKYNEFKGLIDNRRIVDVMSTGYPKKIYLVASNN